MAKSKEREPNFEASLSALERIVAQLESGELPLERALELFEEGVGLSRQCQMQLQEAERKVEMLIRERGEIKIVPFEAAGDGQTDNAEDNAVNHKSLRTVISNQQASSIDTENNEFDNADDAIPF